MIVLGDGAEWSPTARPLTCSAARARRLAARGVWVPGIPPAVPPAPLAAAGETLLAARGLAVARVRAIPVAAGIDLARARG